MRARVWSKFTESRGNCLCLGSDLGGFAAVTTSVQHEHVPPHIVLTRCGFGAVG